MSRGQKLGVIALLASLAAVDYASAACQPYRSDPAFLAELQRDDFESRLFPALQPPTPEERQRLRAIARERRPDYVPDLARLEAVWRLTTGAPLPYPVVRRAPLEWKLEPTSTPVADAVRIEFDGNGDGQLDLILKAGERPKSAAYIYKEGDYQFVMKIHDRSGRVYAHKGRLIVVSPTVFDSRLQTIWGDLKEALRRGERNAALECIHTQSRKRYGEIFAAISDLPARVDETLTAIHAVEERQSEGVYEMVRKKDGQTQSFQVRFEIDADAIWRLRSF